MAESLYSMLSKMLLDEEVVKKATKKARDKIKKSYDANVRKKMIQYYLDQYKPKSYKRHKTSPLFLAYKSRSAIVDGGLAVETWTEETGVDISEFYESNSYYHEDDAGSGKWETMSDIHSITGRQYMMNIDYFHDEYNNNHGTVMGSWILENFEKGIHPRTNGWPRKKWSRKMKYNPKIDAYSPIQMADVYSGEFEDMDMPYQYIYSEMYKEWQKRFN